MSPEQIKALQISLNQRGANLKVDGILGPKTLSAMNNAVSKAVTVNPDLAHLTSQNSPDSIVNAHMSNNWSSVVDSTGKPFSDQDQQEALAKATADLQPAFSQEQNYNELTTGNILKDKVNTYSDYLTNAKSSFQSDKDTLDKNAADSGVLFSGGRYQKEQNLKNKYEQDQSSKLASLGSDIGKTANDFAYKYGSSNLNNPSLSQYYQVGMNSYNPNVATGGVKTGGLSSLYNPTGTNYQGTEVNKNKAAVAARSLNLLANKANKIVPYGYKNQF